MVNARSRCIWWRTVLHRNTVSTSIPFKEAVSPNMSGEMTQRVRRAHTRFERHGAHSQMTGAVRFPEQLCLMTDGGRWSGHSKAMTVTFNLQKQHANTHRNTPTTTAHYDIFFPLHTLHVWLLSCLLGVGTTPEGTRAEPVTKQICLSLGILFLFPLWIST